MLEIHVCIGSSCHLKGAYQVINALKEKIENGKYQDQIVVKGAFCLGQCTKAVSVKMEEELFSLTEEKVEDFFNEEVLRRI